MRVPDPVSSTSRPNVPPRSGWDTPSPTTGTIPATRPLAGSCTGANTSPLHRPCHEPLPHLAQPSQIVQLDAYRIPVQPASPFITALSRVPRLCVERHQLYHLAPPAYHHVRGSLHVRPCQIKRRPGRTRSCGIMQDYHVRPHNLFPVFDAWQTHHAFSCQPMIQDFHNKQFLTCHIFIF